MNKNLIVIVTLLVASQFSFAVETTNNSTNNPAQVESPIKTGTKKSKETAKTETTEKKKKKSFFAIFDIIGKIKDFVGGKSKQNENAIEDAANGVYQPRAKRALSSDPKARAIQEKLDKMQAERLKKYETD